MEDAEYFARYLYTPDDASLFEVYCGGKQGNLELYGFADRNEVGLSNSNARISFPGDVFWSNGRLQFFGNASAQDNILKFAQTAYFVSIVVVQWADLLISKTRKLSVLE